MKSTQTNASVRIGMAASMVHERDAVLNQLRVLKAKARKMDAMEAVGPNSLCKEACQPSGLLSSSTFLGCYQDNTLQLMQKVDGNMTYEGCEAAAGIRGLRYFGLQATNPSNGRGNCFVGGNLPVITSLGTSQRCVTQNGRIVGGTLATALYDRGVDGQLAPGPSQCVAGYHKKPAGFFKWGRIEGRGGGENVTHCDACGTLCSKTPGCVSYDCSPLDLRCSLYEWTLHKDKPYQDYVFCTR